MATRVQELRDTLARIADRTAELESIDAELQGERYAKYQQILAKDREYDELIAAFPAARDEMMAKISATQRVVVGLLEHIGARPQIGVEGVVGGGGMDGTYSV